MIKQEIEDDRLDKDNDNEEENWFWNMIINEFDRNNGKYSVMLLIMYIMTVILEIIII